MAEGEHGVARPAIVDDLKLLLRALNEHEVDSLLIGGYALFALGYQRGTTDIDIVLRPTYEQGELARKALLVLPDKVAADLLPEWFVEAETIRLSDAFVVNLMFNACGETYESLLPHAVTVDLDGVPVRTIDLERMLKTKQTSRDKDKMDRIVLERALAELRKLK